MAPVPLTEQVPLEVPRVNPPQKQHPAHRSPLSRGSPKPQEEEHRGHERRGVRETHRRRMEAVAGGGLVRGIMAGGIIIEVRIMEAVRGIIKRLLRGSIRDLGL